MNKAIKQQLSILENEYEKDFKPIVGFYSFHVKSKNITIKLKNIAHLGVTIEARKQEKDIALIDINTFSTNVIYFSSSKKSKNVKNLMWYIRCLAHHPENIEKVTLNGIEYYKLWCGHKDNKTGLMVPNMKGLVECSVWPNFIKGLTEKIIEDENI